MTKKIDALFISDVHLGSRGSKSRELLETLKQYEPKKLVIVGDFIDGWLLKKRHFWTQDNTNVIRKVLSFSKKGTEVIYITGNHDDFLRSYDGLDFGNIKVVDEYLFDGVWCVHGDKYDTIVMNRKWLAVIGSAGYEVLLVANKANQWLRKVLGLRPRSLSKWVKNKVKGAANFITSFETMVTTEGKGKSAHTVIAGHIHTAADKHLNGVRYINTGDWIENLTYVTLKDGTFELKHHSSSPSGDEK